MVNTTYAKMILIFTMTPASGTNQRAMTTHSVMRKTYSRLVIMNFIQGEHSHFWTGQVNPHYMLTEIRNTGAPYMCHSDFTIACCIVCVYIKPQGFIYLKI